MSNTQTLTGTVVTIDAPHFGNGNFASVKYQKVFIAAEGQAITKALLFQASAGKCDEIGKVKEGDKVFVTYFPSGSRNQRGLHFNNLYIEDITKL